MSQGLSNADIAFRLEFPYEGNHASSNESLPWHPELSQTSDDGEKPWAANPSTNSIRPRTWSKSYDGSVAPSPKSPLWQSERSYDWRQTQSKRSNRSSNSDGTNGSKRSGMTIISLRGDSEVVAQKGKIADVYDMDVELGQGTHGTVWLAVRKQSGQRFAIKECSTSKAKVFENEFRITKKLKHPNIVKIHDVLFTGALSYLVMDLCTAGDLVEYWTSNFKAVQRAQKNLPSSDNDLTYIPPPAKLVGKIIWQMLQAVRYLHHHMIVHRDLKLQNVLLDMPSYTGFGQGYRKSGRVVDTRATVKIADFGSSTVIRKGGFLFENVCTVTFAAPEMLEGSGYDQKADTWSLGVCAYALLNGLLPMGMNHGEAKPAEFHKIIMEKEIVYDEIIQNYSLDTARLLQGLLEKDKKKRLSARHAIASNKWIRSEGKQAQDGEACCCVVS